MKKHLLKLSVSLLLGGVIFFVNIQSTASHTAGGTSISGYSGSTFDKKNCSTCHVSPIKGYVSGITSNIPVTGYIPGTTYTITCTSRNSTASHNANFGFEFTPQNQSTGKVIGTLANITTTGKGSTIIASSTWITHTSTSYTATDSNTWSFKWTAPTVGVGAVPFYAAFNCGSAATESTGWIYLDSTHVPQASTVGVNEIAEAATDVIVYPNPIKDAFNVSYTLQDAKQVEINVFSLDGRKVVNLLANTEQAAGDHNQLLHMPSIASGIYLIQVIQGEQSTCKKIIVE